MAPVTFAPAGAMTPSAEFLLTTIFALSIQTDRSEQTVDLDQTLQNVSSDSALFATHPGSYFNPF